MHTPTSTTDFSLIQYLDDRMKKLVVQEMTRSYIWYRLMQAGNLVKCYETIQVPFYISPPQLGKWIDKGDKLPDATSSNIVMGEGTNRFVVVPSGMDMLDEMIHEGDPNKLFEMADLKSLEAAWALRRTINAGLWNGTGGKQPDGIATVIEKLAPASQVAVVMGINKATNAWARTKFVQQTGNSGVVPAGSTLPTIYISLLSLIQQCTNGTLKPTDLITLQNVFEVLRRSYLEISSPQHLITDYSTAEMGFENFKFYGSYIGWDSNCPTDSVYALHLNEKYDPAWVGDPNNKAKLDPDLEDIGANSLLEVNGSIAMLKHPGINMRRIAPRSPYRELTQTEWILHAINLVYPRLADNGVLGSNTGSGLGTW